MDQQSYGEEAQAQASAKLSETREQAARAVHTATEASGSFMENQKHLAASEVDGYACALHETARQLHQQNQNGVADFAERAAKGLDRLAYNLRERDIGYSLDRLSDFARREPALFLSGAVATGFIITRFMKSSRSPEYGEGQSRVKEAVSSAKEKVMSGAKEAKEKVKESAVSAKEKAGEEKKVEEEKAAPEAESKEHYTAADVEVPVILKPHEAEPHSKGPKGPSPNP